MNFDAAISAHSQWKVKLRMFINGTGEPLDPVVVGADNKCALGQWIYGEGQKFKSDPLFENLRQQHALFHKSAADVINKVKAGQKPAAESLLNGNYSAISTQVISLLQKLRKQHAESK